jgi:hypothetical protein
MANSRENSELNAELLGYHLGLADEESRARVEAAFPDARALDEALEAVRRSLAPLDLDIAAEPPVNLTARILDRVGEAKQTLPFKQPAAVAADAAAVTSSSSRPLMRMRELVGLAAAIALFVGVFVPGYNTARTANQRAVCANNMRSIGNGYSNYAVDSGGYYPYAGPTPDGFSWMRPVDSTAQHLSNARHVFKLIQGRYVPPPALICPGREGDFPLEAALSECGDGFPDTHNNSYATPLVTEPWTQQDFRPDAPLAADMSPIADGAGPRIRKEDFPANSRSHGPLGGQNVLRGNLSVRFFRNPLVGIENDDIYRLIGVQEYTGLERPTARSDAFLIP